jgi:hypothetical protein
MFGLANLDSRIYEVGFVNHETKRIFLESGFLPTIRNKSLDLRKESMFLQISYTILASLLKLPEFQDFFRALVNQRLSIAQVEFLEIGKSFVALQNQASPGLQDFQLWRPPVDFLEQLFYGDHVPEVKLP